MTNQQRHYLADVQAGRLERRADGHDQHRRGRDSVSRTGRMHRDAIAAGWVILPDGASRYELTAEGKAEKKAADAETARTYGRAALKAA